MYYPSGKRSTFVYNESHKQICRAVFRGQNVEKCIIDIIGKSGPDHITSLASKIVSEECTKLCKRGSGTVQQENSYEGIFSFSWDNFTLRFRSGHHTPLNLCHLLSAILLLNQVRKNSNALCRQLHPVFMGGAKKCHVNTTK